MSVNHGRSSAAADTDSIQWLSVCSASHCTGLPVTANDHSMSDMHLLVPGVFHCIVALFSLQFLHKFLK